MGKYLNNKELGIYVDIVLGELFFVLLDKYEFGCGWLLFIKLIELVYVVEFKDISYGMI